MSTTVTGYYYGNMKVPIAVFLGLPSINIYCHVTSHVSHIFWYILRSMHELRREISHFRVVSSTLYSHANESCTEPRFESETFWNSEMAYCHVQRFMENVKTKPRMFLSPSVKLGFDGQKFNFKEIYHIH